MLNTVDILETVQMIREENLDMDCRIMTEACFSYHIDSLEEEDQHGCIS